MKKVIDEHWKVSKEGAKLNCREMNVNPHFEQTDIKNNIHPFLGRFNLYLLKKEWEKDPEEEKWVTVKG